jgi:hypothetical protein
MKCISSCASMVIFLAVLCGLIALATLQRPGKKKGKTKNKESYTTFCKDGSCYQTVHASMNGIGDGDCTIPRPRERCNECRTCDAPEIRAFAEWHPRECAGLYSKLLYSNDE